MAEDDFLRDILTGPRGRRVCLALADEASVSSGGRLWGYSTWSTAVGPQRQHRRRGNMDVLAQELGAAVASVDLAALAAATETEVFLPALLASVDSARYWQDPEEEDEWLADPWLTRLLRPIAEALARAPATAWWSAPVDLDAQQHLHWLFESSDWQDDRTPSTAGAAAALERWRREALDDETRAAAELPLDVHANYSGQWWSPPKAPAGLLVTTPVLPATTPPDAQDRMGVGMVLVEDSQGVEAIRARPVHPRPGVRVYEIHDARAWCELVTAHPMRVTRSRRHDWWRATGWAGSWVLPDWRSVAAEWDGVHLSVRGYLATSGRLLETGAPQEQAASGIEPGPARTLLAGWSPAETYWLTDALDHVGDGAIWRSSGDDHPLKWRHDRP